MSNVVTDADAKKYIAANVARLLETRGWMQQDLAEATGENKMTISRVCRGIHVPSAALLARIAEALDVSTDRLIAPPPEFSLRKSG
jgi:transcriptional regulator with XRE-family HTH domain